MYIPKAFKFENRDEILNLISKHPFATLISCSQDKPFISHLPLVAQIKEDTLTLLGHFSKGNPHWRICDSNPKLTVVFHGPDTYVTPTWYKEYDVPTWNYAVVHCEGTMTLLSQYDEVVHCLKMLHEQSKKNFDDTWEFDIPTDMKTQETLTRATIGFEIVVTDMKAKFKLNQNRTEIDRAGVIEGLASRKDDKSRGILELMIQT